MYEVDRRGIKGILGLWEVYESFMNVRGVWGFVKGCDEIVGF